MPKATIEIEGRGYEVTVERVSDKPEFCCIAMGEWIAEGRVMKHYKGKLSITPANMFSDCSAARYLSFCPFCGTKLP